MKTITKKIMTCVALLAALFVSTKAKAQCGPTPIASPLSSWTICSGATTDVILNLGLGGGPYNIQYGMDYLFPGSPIGAISINEPGPSYSVMNLTTGSYKIYVVDIGHGNCYDSTIFTINADLINSTVATSSILNGCGDSALINFTISGGMPPYFINHTVDSVNYSMLTTSSNTTPSVYVSPGMHGFRVMDSYGCINQATTQALGIAPDTLYPTTKVRTCPIVYYDSVTYLTGGNQTITRTFNLLRGGWNNWSDSLVMRVVSSDYAPEQRFATTVANAYMPITFNRTLIQRGVIYVSYLLINSATNDTLGFTERINNNGDVFPGDANGDGTTNHVDLLNIGIGFGTTGVVRPSASINYVPQACPDWTQNFNTGLNYKHADCDGDGLISYSDTVAIQMNWNFGQWAYKLANETHVMSNPNAPTIAVNFPAGNYSVGTPLTIPVTLGTSTVPANNIYGVAFTINYPTTAIDGNSVGIDFSNSWMGAVGAGSVAISRNNTYGNVNVAISRTNHQNISGSGTICDMKIITIDNVSGKPMGASTEYFTISNVTLIDKDGNPIAVNTEKDSIVASGTTGINAFTKSTNVKVYPNPAKDVINITSEENIEEIQLMDISGRVVMNMKSNAASVHITTEGIEQGFYFLRVRSANHIENRSVEIVK